MVVCRTDVIFLSPQHLLAIVQFEIIVAYVTYTWLWWCGPVISVLWDAEAGGLQDEA